MKLEESLCGTCDAFLLGKSDTFRSTTVRAVSAVPDFCKNQRVPVHHDQVNFTKAAVIVPLQCLETSFMQKRLGKLLPLTTLKAPVIHSP